MSFPTSINVTGHEINLSGLTEDQKNYFIELKDKVVSLYEQNDKDKAAISFSGQSGVGKSATVEILRTLLEDESHSFATYAVGLDAFHYSNAELEEKGLKDVKGRYDTYDLGKFNRVMTRFFYKSSVHFPVYSRETHEPIEAGFIVADPKALLLVDGLWFLRDDKEWNELRTHFFYNFLITGDEELTKQNVIERHIRGGRSEEDAKAFYESSDHKNAIEVLNKRAEADETILYYKEI